MKINPLTFGCKQIYNYFSDMINPQTNETMKTPRSEVRNDWMIERIWDIPVSKKAILEGWTSATKKELYLLNDDGTPNVHSIEYTWWIGRDCSKRYRLVHRATLLGHTIEKP